MQRFSLVETFEKDNFPKTWHINFTKYIDTMIKHMSDSVNSSNQQLEKTVVWHLFVFKQKLKNGVG